MICRACRKRPESIKVRYDDPILEEAMSEVLNRNKGLCSECSIVASMARIDQSIETIRRGH